ncbi:MULTISPECIES: glycosyltransferase family 4 protein [Prauserella salsuginis group]|uniref:Glycosyltransferase family 4 protein n=1 Tax=Prauserella salsuginis TaxID=387889 RepID=A0ABW6G8B5_9PSEU|nr:MULTISPECIES: glycosyltransferase family 4 protein [Prauserella salsuginis group]MCR3721818.1 Glycosyltransferase involved in cell wall bisynthesis [Prauserella flava]MCR3734509.1 Glycosyltransferase involved in cell wall bisynthesis [Prauserella salsuginis]
MRIALLSYRSKPHCGGQGVYVRHLSRGLSELGHDVEVLSGQPYPDLDDPGRLTKVPSLDLYRESDPFRTPRLGEYRDAIDLFETGAMWTAGFPEPLTFSLRAARLLRGRASDFDVVHDNQCLGYGLLGLQRAGVPLLATVHHPITRDRVADLAAASWRRKLAVRRWYGFVTMQARVARRLPRLITVSQASAGDIAEDFRVAQERLTTIPLGVDTELFRPAGGRVPGRIVAVASADVPLKGVRHLLESVAKLRVERDVELVLVSKLADDGPTRRLIDELAIGDVVRAVHGLADDELAGLLASAEVACVPSLYEGFSLPTVEAMACGTPLVVSRAGALPEVVGDCGRLVPPGDTEALTRELATVLDDRELRGRLGDAGRARALERYSWRSVAASTVDVYREVIDRTRRKAG